MVKSKTEKTDLLLKEREQIRLESAQATAAPATHPGPATAKSAPKLMGRPKTKPDSKQTSFHIPLDMLTKLEAEAQKITFGNKSGMLNLILEKYFADKK
jgi:hypothetical protein